MTNFLRGPSAPYVAPFAAFVALLAAQNYLPLPQQTEFALRCAILGAVLWFFSRGAISFRVQFPARSIALGVAVFLIWIGPDALIPGYRQHWLFTNSIMGKVSTTLAASSQTDVLALCFRTLRAVVLVPVIEELFWRAWALRWIVRKDFEALPLGSYTNISFWTVALLFASEHGPFWDVGLVCGVVYNWWMGKSRSLGDLILTHAITNGALSVYVLAAKKWEYWM